MAQVTGRKVATTPIVPTPSGGGNVINSWNTSDNKETNAPSMKIVKDGLDEINDNLSGFKYYPIGTAIVGFVADDSAYTDANGNYILADSATGRGLIDNITYKSISSTEKTCGEVGADSASPFSGLSIDLLWTNPNPTSQLSAITLNIDLSEYDALKIYYAGNSTYINDHYTNYGIALVAKGSVITIGGRFPNDANVASGGRNITVNNSSIVISDAHDSGYVSNSWAVPLKIWGIKPSRILDDLLAQS